MLVILRPGPFIDAERDFGGLPYWLLRIDPNMKLRFYDPNFIKYMDQWFNVLLPKIEPFLYNNGGPVISIQTLLLLSEVVLLDIVIVRGSTYVTVRGVVLLDIATSVRGSTSRHCYLSETFATSVRVVLLDIVTSVRGSTSRYCYFCPEVVLLDIATSVRGANVTLNFFHNYYTQAEGPLVNSEFYPGYLDRWGHPHSTRTTESVVKTLTEMLSMNASVNFYLSTGNFFYGFTAGSNIINNEFQACITSYDFDAPLSEAGDPTPKYYALREAIGKFLPLPPGPVPQPSPKMKLPPITLKKIMSIWDYIAKANNLGVLNLSSFI
ncbi:beta-galactosidase-1-like protein [Caerostris extrusa]|uniref:Beta-galactosidase-1-like protein n=1 Tax=Caerostris extrusa TaxID=172846 RepID=A0AAV4UR80_CAEEX|nr:beta-galactosidase-1-like protein [Caerostris extrusa]